jgi:hypothetical protein
MGTTVYMKLGKVEGLSYKTTLLVILFAVVLGPRLAAWFGR